MEPKLQNVMPLRIVENFTEFLTGSILGPDSLQIISHKAFGRALVKFKSYSISEVLGYRLATALGVPVVGAEGFIASSPIKIEGAYIASGQVGVLIEYVIDLKPLTMEEAVLYDPDAMAAALALCVFDRYEWGEFALSGNRLFFFDLERILPSFSSALITGDKWKGVKQSNRHARLRYGHEDTHSILGVLEEARDLDLVARVRDHLMRIKPFKDAFWRSQFSLEPHPLATQIAILATEALATRLALACKIFTAH